MSIAAPAMPVSETAKQRAEIKIYSHAPILYWWPVWLVGFVMALWTYLDNRHMVLVPENTLLAGRQLTVPEGAQLESPAVHVARSKWPGIIFVFTVLLAVLVSTTTVRGAWSLFAIAVLAAFVLLINWLDWWQPLYRWFSLLRIHLNLGAYLTIAVPLFLGWLAVVFFFDRRTYVAYSRGQVRIRDQVGKAEKAFDARGVAFEKTPYDWLRRILGFGAGDMIIRTGGTQPVYFELPNIIDVGRKLKWIEQQIPARGLM